MQIEKSSQRVVKFNPGEEKVNKSNDPTQNNLKPQIMNLKIIILVIAIVLIIVIIILLIKIFTGNKDKTKDEDNNIYNQNNPVKQICPAGYFYPNDDMSLCYPCEIAHCKFCIGEINKNDCTSCIKGYTPSYNDKKIIISCTLSSSFNEKNNICGENCLTCNSDEKICSKCKSGYFSPTDGSNEEKLNCIKCLLDNCEECQGTKNNNICSLCKTNFYAKNENDIIKYCNKKCQTGINEQCAYCDEQKNECINCNSGYYVPDDDENKLECRPCSLENCKSCHGTKDSNICDTCKDNYESILENGVIKSCEIKLSNNKCQIGEGEKCKTCDETEKLCGSCNPSYILINGRCAIYDTLSFRAKYYSKTNNEKIQLIYGDNVKYVKKIIIDGKEHLINILDTEGKYNFDSTGDHIVDITLELKNENILNNLFLNCNKVKSITFNNFKNNENNNIKLTSMIKTFEGCEILTSIDISNIDTSYVTNIYYLFFNNTSLKSIDLSKNNFENVVNASYLFTLCKSISSINISTSFSKLEYFEGGFIECNSLTSIDLSLLNTKNLNRMYRLFYKCTSIEKINLGNLNTEKVTDMISLFYSCDSLTSLDLGNFITKNVLNMSFMFYNCSSLKYINLNSFDTSKVENMYAMFSSCISLNSLNLSSFETTKLQNISFMFYNCSSLNTIDITNFKTDLVKDMKGMFYQCKNLLSIDVSNFNTKNVIDFENMFSNCESLTSLDISNFDFSLSLSTTHLGFVQLIFINCKRLTFLDISSVNLIPINFFEGLPSKGTIKCKRQLRYYLINYNLLVYWEWKIVD